MRELGRTGLNLSPLGFGAFKIGRNQGTKYATSYELPDDASVSVLLNSILDLGCNVIDTAPAYGLSEQRIGATLSHRRSEFVLSTKVGETFENGKSTFDFSADSVRRSLERSLRLLKTDLLDIVFIHSNGDDRRILEETDTADILQEFRARGLIRAIGMSGKTVEGATLALTWADALMVEYHLNDTSHDVLIEQARMKGVAVYVKKGLSSGALPASAAIPFILRNSGVTTLVVGGLSLDHFRENWAIASQSISNFR